MRCGFVKGALTGILAGAAVALMFDPITPRQRRRFVKKAGCVMDDMKKTMKDAMPGK